MRAAALVLLIALTAACTGDPGTEPTPEPTTQPSPTVTETAEPTSEPTETTEPPVDGALTATAYFMLDTRAGLKLARERVPSGPDGDLRAGVEAMIAGPTDPDYSSPWNPDTTVLDADVVGGSLVVDLSEEARTASIGSAGAALMIQQLVYTATEAAGDLESPVTLLIEGEPAGELWGAVTWDEPIARDDPLDVRLLVQIDEPSEGATSGSPVTVSGDAAVFEANLLWSVLDSSGTEIQSGFTMTSEGQTFAPYSFTVDLDPGTYTVVISESDPSDGAAGASMTDSRTVTVT